VSISTTDLKVKDVLLPPDGIPVLPPTTLLKQALEAMNKFRLGVVCIIDEDENLIGIFTDGDVRRLLLKSQKPFAALFVDDIIHHATSTFTSIHDTALLSDAVSIMEEKEIWDLPVLSESEGKFVGLLHLHPAIKAVMGL
jgi:DeoR family transcriptional regulator, catabolite repression regulator